MKTATQQEYDTFWARKLHVPMGRQIVTRDDLVAFETFAHDKGLKGSDLYIAWYKQPPHVTKTLLEENRLDEHSTVDQACLASAAWWDGRLREEHWRKVQGAKKLDASLWTWCPDGAPQCTVETCVCGLVEVWNHHVFGDEYASGYYNNTGINRVASVA